MEATDDIELEMPEDLFKTLSSGTTANGRTMEEEITAPLETSLDREEANQKRH